VAAFGLACGQVRVLREEISQLRRQVEELKAQLASLTRQLSEERARRAAESSETPCTPSGMKPPYRTPTRCPWQNFWPKSRISGAPSAPSLPN
jgi:hypothetical protein